MLKTHSRSPVATGSGWTTWLLLPFLAPALALASTAPTVSLTTQQVKALGIQVQGARPQAQAHTPYPARLSLLPESVQVIAAPLNATVVAVPVGVGDAVKAGQTVLQLRSGDAANALKELQQSRSQQALAQKNLTRDEQLFAEGLISQSRLDQTRAVAQQQAAQQAAQASNLSWRGVKWQADGGVTLQAPLAAQVAEVHALPGQRVEAGTALMTLARTDKLQVEVAVPLAALTTLTVGSTLQVRTPTQAGTDSGAQPLRSTGRIVAIAPTVSSSAQTVAVRGEIPAPQGTWRAGQWVEVSMGPLVDAQRIPAAALMPGVGQAADVFEALENHRYTLRAVKVVGRDGTDVLVQGLRPGAQVVTRGTVALKALPPEAAPPAATGQQR